MSFKFHLTDGHYVSEPVDEPYFSDTHWQSHLYEVGTHFDFGKPVIFITEPEMLIPVRVC